MKIKIDVILAVHFNAAAEREGQLPHLLGQTHGLSGQMAGSNNSNSYGVPDPDRRFRYFLCSVSGLSV